MAQFLGQNPEEVTELAREFDAKAQAVEDVITQLTTKFANTTWTGPDRERFEGDFTSRLTSNLRTVSGALGDAAILARANAEQQVTASQ